jgi:hypothetical protein
MLITGYVVTNTSKHDSQVLDEILEEGKDKEQVPYGESAYGGTEQLKIIALKNLAAKVGEQDYKKRPLTDLQKASNKEKSRTWLGWNMSSTLWKWA